MLKSNEHVIKEVGYIKTLFLHLYRYFKKNQIIFFSLELEVL